MQMKATVVLVMLATAWSARAGDVQFNRDIRPILSDNCFHCHGPDSATRKAKLRLDREDALFGKTHNGMAVAPGKPAESDLYQRITTDDEDDVMPPLKTHKTLTAAQKETVKRWIEQGAPWQPHWSLVAPQRPTPRGSQSTFLRKIRAARSRAWSSGATGS